MKKKLIITIGIIIIIIAFTMIWVYYTIHPDGNKVASFIRNNPDKSAIYLIHNNTVIADQNSDTVMPLAGTVKILIAIEFARQISAGIQHPGELIDTLELDKYYLDGTDGGAQHEWMKSVHNENLLSDEKVPLLEVAKGMIRFSSNANAEFLMDRLGIENINSLRDSLGLKTHQPLYPFVAALVVCMKPKDDETKLFTEKLESMTMELYVQKCFEVHEKLKHDSLFKKSFDADALYMEQQKVWSIRLPGASPKEYVEIMQKINTRRYFDTNTQRILDDLMQWPMKTKYVSGNFIHFGAKSGSTAFVLTEAMYSEDMKNNKTEMAVFFNNLSTLQNIRLQASFNDFTKKVTTDSTFRQKIFEMFNK